MPSWAWLTPKSPVPIRWPRMESGNWNLQLERLTGKKVRAHYSSDPELLGGVVVRVGSTIYDGSVRGQLEKIKQELSTA